MAEPGFVKSLPRAARELVAVLTRTKQPICCSTAIIWNSTKALKIFAQCGNLARVSECLEDETCDPLARDSYALHVAAEKGHTECVRLLIPVSNPLTLDSFALRWAAEKGHTECVRLLIPVSDPLALGSEALRWAAGNGRTDCVRLLIPVSNPRASSSWPLSRAVARGHTGCIELLKPVSDPWVVAELGI